MLLSNSSKASFSLRASVSSKSIEFLAVSLADSTTCLSATVDNIVLISEIGSVIASSIDVEGVVLFSCFSSFFKITFYWFNTITELVELLADFCIVFRRASFSIDDKCWFLRLPLINNKRPYRKLTDLIMYLQYSKLPPKNSSNLTLILNIFFIITLTKHSYWMDVNK